MNPNMSIYMRLNLRLFVQVGLVLALLHWTNMSNIFLTKTIKYVTFFQPKVTQTPLSNALILFFFFLC